MVGQVQPRVRRLDERDVGDPLVVEMRARHLDPMHPHAELIHAFYTAFAKRDAAGMAACYHPDIHFSDEVFIGLTGARAAAMWRMLCERGKDLRIEFRDVGADDSRGHAHWEAWYTLSATGRPVHNIIDARFEFRDGKIIRHLDSFDFPAWASQALGPMGKLLGWSSFLKNRVRAKAVAALHAFQVQSRLAPGRKL